MTHLLIELHHKGVKTIATRVKLFYSPPSLNYPFVDENKRQYFVINLDLCYTITPATARFILRDIENELGFIRLTGERTRKKEIEGGGEREGVEEERSREKDKKFSDRRAKPLNVS